MANGTADNLLLTTYLSARCPVSLPHQWIWICWIIRRQSLILNTEGFWKYYSRTGKWWTCQWPYRQGKDGRTGRNLKEIGDFFTKKKSPWRAGIFWLMPDLPVNLLTRSFSKQLFFGKMGIALADAAAEYGADVHLVLGPWILVQKIAQSELLM